MNKINMIIIKTRRGILLAEGTGTRADVLEPKGGAK
jgi:hypothetical protein